MGMRAGANTGGTGRKVGRHRHAHSTSSRSGLPVIAIAGSALFFAVSGTGGTYALLTASATTPATTTIITSGSADLNVSTVSLATSALYPGLTLYGTITATNTGDVPLLLGVSGLTAPGGTATTALSQALVIGVGPAASSAACSSGAVTPTWSGSFAAAMAGTIGTTVPVGAKQLLCISVSLPLTAPVASQGQSAMNFALRLTGTQS